jgi:hypothetical protein
MRALPKCWYPWNKALDTEKRRGQKCPLLFSRKKI